MNSTKRGDFLKSIMLGLIYPAVLGSVMFSALQVVVDPLVATFWLPAGSQPVAIDPMLTLKLGLLLVTIGFYCSDYVYIMFTRDFDWPFFLCDCVFLLTLYFTFYAIGAGKPFSPQVVPILLCYSVFMVLYLVWDWSEFKKCKKCGKNIPEIAYYKLVIAWEVISLSALLLAAWRLDESLNSVRKATLILALITVSFGYIAWRKRKFFQPEAPNTAAQAKADAGA